MDSRLEALERLARLREQHALTEAEFEAEKARLLSDEGALDVEHRRSEPGRLLTPPYFWAGVVLLVAIGVGVYLGVFASDKRVGENVEERAAMNDPPQSLDEAEPVWLSAILDFELPSECEPGDELDTLLDDMRSLAPGTQAATVTVGIDGPTVRPQVTRLDQGGGAVVARLEAPSTWEGLRVTELRTTRFRDSDIDSFQIRFSENPNRVRRKLIDAGFDIPEIGELKTVDLEEGHGLVYGVERISDGASLLCAHL